MQEVCKLPFSIGKFYQDEIQYDVVEMAILQSLLGKPWKYDVGALQKEKKVYIFVLKRKKIALLPTTKTY